MMIPTKPTAPATEPTPTAPSMAEPTATTINKTTDEPVPVSTKTDPTPEQEMRWVSLAKLAMRGSFDGLKRGSKTARAILDGLAEGQHPLCRRAYARLERRLR